MHRRRARRSPPAVPSFGAFELAAAPPRMKTHRSCGEADEQRRAMTGGRQRVKLLALRAVETGALVAAVGLAYVSPRTLDSGRDGGHLSLVVPPITAAPLVEAAPAPLLDNRRHFRFQVVPLGPDAATTRRSESPSLLTQSITAPPAEVPSAGLSPVPTPPPRRSPQELQVAWSRQIAAGASGPAIVQRMALRRAAP